MKRHMKCVLVLAMTLITPAVVTAQAPAAPADNVNPAVLEVNGEKIYAAEISMTMRNVIAQMGGDTSAESQEAALQMATQRMVEQTLLAQEARRTNVQPNEERLAAMVRNVEQQAGGRDALESSMGNFGMSYDQLVEYLLEMELSRSLIAEQISPTIEVTEEQVKTFYDENPELFDAEEQVRVSVSATLRCIEVARVWVEGETLDVIERHQPARSIPGTCGLWQRGEQAGRDIDRA